MKIFCLNTAHGLIPMYDDDYEEKKKLKIGNIYEADIKFARNYEFHKKHFALINCSWEFLNERQTAFFKESKRGFRKTFEIAAGHYEPVYNLERKEWQQAPKSIAFDKMDEFEFRSLYDRVKNEIFNVALKNTDYDYFMKNLVNF